MTLALILISTFAIIGVLISSGLSWNSYIAKGIIIGAFGGSLLTLILSWGFLPVENIGLYLIGLPIGADSIFELSGLGYIFSILTTFTMIISVLASWYLAVDTRLFYGLLVIINLCLIGAFSCTNIFLFLIFFELSALPVFILIGYCGSARRERLKANYYFLFFTFYGSMSLLIILLSSYSILNTNYLLSSEILGFLAYILLFISFAIKIPLFPFHIWLPYAHVEASTVSSIILAALLLKLGGYGLIKFLIPGFSIDVSLYYRPIILFVCLVGFVYGSLCATRQIDLKRQIAFSSVAHMSFAIIGIYALSVIGVGGSIFLMFSHGLISSALFFLVGTLSDRYHTRAITAFSGLLGTMPLFSGFLIVAILANVGFPGTSGFVPELLILISVVRGLPTLVLIMLLGMVITALSNLIIPLRILFGHPRVLISKGSWADLGLLESSILGVLAILIIGFGFFNFLPPELVILNI